MKLKLHFLSVMLYCITFGLPSLLAANSSPTFNAGQNMAMTTNMEVKSTSALSTSNSSAVLQILSNTKIDCKKDQSGGHDPNGDGRGCLKACDSTTVNYYTSPTPGSTYQWIVSGAISFTPSANQVNVNWGGVGLGQVKLIETKADSSQDSTQQCIEIILSPTANFSAAPSIISGQINVCLSQPVNFTDLSLGATNWFWDFGDGNTFSGQNPMPHAYTTSGTYTITLIVKNDCGCTDTLKVDVIVDELPGPEIDCPSVVCEGDTAVYTTSAVCSNYNWTVNGGTIISSPLNSNSIVVVWGSGASGPGTVTLNISGCSGLCTVPTTITISIIPKNALINGAITVCQYSTTNYSVPNIPATIYNWTVIPGGTIIGGQGTNTISVYWNTTGIHSVEVDYYNKFLDCGGKGLIKVKVLPPYFIGGPSELCANTVNTALPFNANSYSGPASVNWSVVTPGGATLSNLQTSSTTFNTYNWSAGSGYYTVIAVAPAGTYCNDTIKTTVHVLNPLPIPSISGTSLICPGGTYQYTATSVALNTTFTWTVVGGTITPPSGTGSVVSVTWNLTGPYALSVSQALTLPPNCSSLPASISIQKLPNPVISGSSTTCINGNTLYTATNYPGLTYNWVLSPSGLGSIVSGNGTDSIQIQWLNAAGTASLSISYPECPSLSSSFGPITLTNAPAPTITPSGILCSNGPGINLTSSSAASYSWTNGSNVAFGGNNQSVPISSGGHYNLSVTYSNGCAATNSINVNAAPSPVASISSPAVLAYCNAPVPLITFYALNGAGYTFQWLWNGNPINLATNPTYTTNVLGGYSVIVTLGSCSSTSNTLVISQVPDCDTGCVTLDTVGFTYSQPACNPVSFFGVKSAGIGSHSWNFGDPLTGGNNYSNLMNPTHIFSNAGFYNVVFSGIGVSANTPPDSCLTQKLLTVKVPLVAKFKIRNQCLSDTIFYTDLSTYTPGDNITSWLWNFGDPGSGANNTSTLQNPFHIFSVAGIHTISLTVANALCTLTYTLTDTILDATPVISIAPSPTCVNTPIAFSGTSTSTILNWLWNFGDATSSVLQNVEKSYTLSGLYPISLSVIDAQGCKGTAISSVNILPPPIPDTITPLTPTTICFGDSVTLQAPAGTAYLWSNNATTQNIVVSQSGNYYVTVTNSNGCMYTTASVTVTVIAAPSVSISGKTNMCEGEYLFLTTTTGASYLYQWYFNNALLPGEINYYYQKPGVTFADAGSYSVTVTDTITGCSATATFNVNVNPVPAVPIVVISPNGPYCSGHLYTLIVTNPNPSLTYTWNNGSTGTSIVTAIQGNYSVQATNQYGCSSYSNNIFIAPSPAIENVISGCYEFCDTLMPRIIPGPPGYASYQWILTNTNTTVGTNQYLSVSTAGVYALILTNSFGCIDTSEHIEITFVHCTDCEKLSVDFSSVESDSINDCCWNIAINNMYSDTLLSALQIHTINNIGLNFSNLDTAWSVQSFNNSSVVIVPNSGSIPFGSNNNLIQLCLSGITDSTQQVVFTWIGQGPEYNKVCSDTLQFNCAEDHSCAAIINDSLYCDGDTLHYSFYIKNFGTHNIQSIDLHLDSLSGVTATPNAIVTPPILPGATYGPISLILSGPGLIPGNQICFTISAQDSTTDENSPFCCTDHIEHCIIVPPLCNPCDSLNVTVEGSSLDCCWSLNLMNHAYVNIVGVQTHIISGGGYVAINNPLGSGWHMNFLSNTNITWTTSNGQPIPMNSILPKICLEGTEPGPHVLVVNWLVQGIEQDTILCSDTVILNCLSDCIGLIKDTVTCNDDGTYQFSFATYNNFINPINEFEFVGYSPSSAFVTPPVFTGTIPVSGLALFTTTVTGNPGDKICFRIKAYDSLEDGEHHNCCTTDSIYCIVLPNCKDIEDAIPQKNQSGNALSIFPNPLRGKVNVSFSVPQSSVATFKVYNLSGALVSVPFTSKVEGKKSYTFNFDANALETGTYVGVISTTKGYATYKKMIVAK